MPGIKLDVAAEQMLTNYYWQGNVRQLKNITEQISVIEKTRDIDADTLAKYLPQQNSSVPMVIKQENKGNSDFSERDILYKILFDMKKDMTDLKKVVVDLIENDNGLKRRILNLENAQIIKKSL